MYVLSFFTHNLAFYKFPDIACQHRALHLLPFGHLSRINTARHLRGNVQLHRQKRRKHQSRQSAVATCEIHEMRSLEHIRLRNTTFPENAGI